MRRLLLVFAILLAASWLALQMNMLPAPVARVLWPIVGLACSLSWPLLFISIYVAPGLFRGVIDDSRHFWRRIRTRRIEVEDLERKIAHLDRPHHMVQLGMVYAGQGKPAKAQDLFTQALAKDPAMLEARYRLALCKYDQGEFAQATELLEEVHRIKPEYDYGQAYLRLAQSQQRVGNAARAAEVYDTLLRFYPGHAEGSYGYAMQLAEQGDRARATALLKELMFTVRHSPAFQRRRNRHWALKARWWLMRNGAA